MERLRSFFDGDRAEVFTRPTATKTIRNKHEMFCGICGAKLYVDEGMFSKLNNSVEEGLDIPLLCEDCEEAYEELAHPQ